MCISITSIALLPFEPFVVLDTGGYTAGSLVLQTFCRQGTTPVSAEQKASKVQEFSHKQTIV